MNSWNDFIEIKNIFDELGIKWFVHSGSSLGLYRDKTPIVEGSHSLGFGIYGLKYLKEIGEKLIEKGFTLKPTFETDFKGNHKPLTCMIEFKREVAGMVYFFVKNPDYYQSYLDPTHPYLYFPLQFDQIETIKINDVDINFLSPIEDYLQWVFGNWKVKEGRKSYPPAKGL